ncbi:hypothetical protein M0R72_07670 [Candidatus Pacearchaeota archaeon]|jgi:hypothetical protein|nr:hypothetical protein [Candidatus Pacearchaeota archaeon]
MKISPSGTEYEPGDPCNLSFCLACCPICGVRLDSPDCDGYTTGGHVHCGLNSRLNRILFRACSKHFKQAEIMPIRQPCNKAPGYLGEWNPAWGIAAKVVFFGNPKSKIVRII